MQLGAAGLTWHWTGTAATEAETAIFRPLVTFSVPDWFFRGIVVVNRLLLAGCDFLSSCTTLPINVF